MPCREQFYEYLLSNLEVFIGFDIDVMEKSYIGHLRFDISHDKVLKAENNHNLIIRIFIFRREVIIVRRRESRSNKLVLSIRTEVY